MLLEQFLPYSPFMGMYWFDSYVFTSEGSCQEFCDRINDDGELPEDWQPMRLYRMGELTKLERDRVALERVRKEVARWRQLIVLGAHADISRVIESIEYRMKGGV